MKKVIKIQSKYLRDIRLIKVYCMEYGTGATYKTELRILFLSKNGIIKSLSYKYTLKNIYRFLDIAFLPYKLDKRVIYNLKNNNISRY